MNNSKKEDGYILVVVIGILTILSLMAITFATLSRIETRATRNYTDSVKCEMVAKAGLEHAIYVLRQDKFGYDNVAYDSDPPDSPDENYDWSGETWMPGNIDLSNPLTSFAGNVVGDCDNNGDLAPDSKWIYFPATLSTSNSDIRLPGNLRARYAVLITDDREARVNINVSGNKAGIASAHTSNEGWSTFEIDLSKVIELAPGLDFTDGDNIASDIIDIIVPTIGRLGNDQNPGTSTVHDDTGIVPDPLNDGIDNDGDLIVDEADENTDEPNEFNSIFPYGDDVPFGLLSEAEIMGTSSYTSRLETIFNNRGVSLSDQASLQSWLTTYSADTIVCPPYQLDGGTSTTMLNINALVNNEGAYTNTTTYDSDKKVEMLIDVLEEGGILDSPGTEKYVECRQLAVNIKDFIDSDDTVTKYPESLIPPVYYGVERTPYINEVEAWTSSGTDEFIELFNPYDTAIPNTGNWTITLDGDTTTITLPGLTIPAGGYYVIADQAGAGVDLVDAAGINNLDNGGEELILRDSNGNIVQVTNYGSANQARSMQLNDPRPTPLEDDDGSTNVDASTPWRWDNETPITPGAENDNFDPSPPNQDDEWTSGTWSSSFLVANRRFSNKGYLGFIHTGRQWYSFKVDDNIVYPDVLQYFTVTDPSMDGIDNDGDFGTDTYDTDGDGDIDANDTGDTSFQSGDFDGKEYRIPGLINVNTASTQVLQSLPNIGTSEASAIIGGRTFTSIGEVANVFTGIPGNKWNREKPFRSISNLITTRSNVFTVYVTAQITDEAMSNVYSEKRIIAIVDRSVDPIKVRYFRWIVE